MIPLTQNSIKHKVISSEKKAGQWFPGVGGRIMKEHEETLGGDGYVHYLDYGDGFTGGYVCQIYQIKHFKYV